VLDRYRELTADVWKPGRADPVLLEICRLRIAHLIGDAAELATRSRPAIDAGLTEAKLEELSRWPTSPLYSAGERAALNFAEVYVADPHSITDADAARLHEHYDPPELATLTTALALFDAMSRLRVALGITPESPGTITVVDRDHRAY
jgi:alkylhydroperoxidase family enzyme